jgi:hypothetical protein
MYDRIKLVAGGVLVVVLGLSALSRRFPHVAWLQIFRYDPPRLTEEQRATMRRRANVYSGVQLILLGIVLPMLYVAGTLMFFNDFTTKGIALALGASALCIGLGVTAIWQSRRG